MTSLPAHNAQHHAQHQAGQHKHQSLLKEHAKNFLACGTQRQPNTNLTPPIAHQLGQNSIESRDHHQYRHAGKCSGQIESQPLAEIAGINCLLHGLKVIQSKVGRGLPENVSHCRRHRNVSVGLHGEKDDRLDQKLVKE